MRCRRSTPDEKAYTDRRCRKGNRYVREVLVQAAHGVRRSRTYLGERDRRLKKRRGSKRGALAIGHDILVILHAFSHLAELFTRFAPTSKLPLQLTNID